jgi:hypothetical protein
MLDVVRARFSYANVTATLALFVALGGVSYAAVSLPAKSVGSKQLRHNAVTSSKVKNHTLRVADLRKAAARELKGAQGPAGPKGATGPAGPTGPVGPATGAAGGDLSGSYPNPSIAGGAVTTAKFAPGAKAPDAGALDGIDSLGFIQGTGNAMLASANIDLSGVLTPATTPIGTIPGLGSFAVGGYIAAPGDDCQVTFTNTSGGPLAVNGDANPGLADGATIELAGADARPAGSQASFTILAPGAATVATGQVTVTFGFPGANVVCAGAVHALVNG